MKTATAAKAKTVKRPPTEHIRPITPSGKVIPMGVLKRARNLARKGSGSRHSGGTSKTPLVRQGY